MCVRRFSYRHLSAHDTKQDAQNDQTSHPPALSLPRQTLRPGTRLSPSKAADESKPEAYSRGPVEDFDESSTQLTDVFSILLALIIHDGSLRNR